MSWVRSHCSSDFSQCQRSAVPASSIPPDVQPRALTGLRFDLGVKADRVLLQGGDPRVGVHRVEPARRVPGGTGGELLALDQRDVGKAAQREVIQDAAPDDAAADHDDLVLVLHVRTASGQGIRARSLSVPGRRGLTIGRIARTIVNTMSDRQVEVLLRSPTADVYDVACFSPEAAPGASEYADVTQLVLPVGGVFEVHHGREAVIA